MYNVKTLQNLVQLGREGMSKFEKLPDTQFDSQRVKIICKTHLE